MPSRTKVSIINHHEPCEFPPHPGASAQTLNVGPEALATQGCFGGAWMVGRVGGLGDSWPWPAECLLWLPGPPPVGMEPSRLFDFHPTRKDYVMENKVGQACPPYG